MGNEARTRDTQKHKTYESIEGKRARKTRNLAKSQLLPLFGHFYFDPIAFLNFNNYT